MSDLLSPQTIPYKVRPLTPVRMEPLLNKMELLCWDGIEGLREDQAADQLILDEIATLSLNPDSTELRDRCATVDRWQLPRRVTCFNPMIGPAVGVEVG